ncbi:MAG: amidohydrolase family protein [Gemmatimonadaceae bacterium]|nr:amidohydrolase family protein [Chitinophagaceae bacterium]
MIKLFISCVMISATVAACAQGSDKMDFERYEPKSTLVVPEHKPDRAKFPFVDIHNHQYGLKSSSIPGLLTDMDKLNMKVMVNLSGGTGSNLQAMTGAVKETAPKRFIIFANIDFNGLGESGWSEKAAKQLETDVKNGANGLKIFKNLGFSVKDNTGKRVAVDDPRLDAIWAKAGELKIPVLIHTADPKPFWDPVDEKNERWLEITTHPGRKRGPSDPEPFDELIAEQHRVFKKHIKTTFIAAHFGWYPNDLGKLARLMDEMPNICVEFGAVIAELGRQPRAARQFFEKYQDRILFGKDSWVPAEYATYFRVLETTDEYFPYHKKYHAYWRMYGIGLSDEVLKKVYYKNALRIVPNIDKNLFPQ